MFSSPCLGILFSLHCRNNYIGQKKVLFSSPCLGILFSLYDVIKDLEVDESKFSPPCLGILFSLSPPKRETLRPPCFRPHVWGFFFHTKGVSSSMRYKVYVEFSSPCLGILFSHSPFSGNKITPFLDSFRPHVWGFFFHSRPGRPHGVGSLWPFCGGDFQLIGILIIFTL